MCPKLAAMPFPCLFLFESVKTCFQIPSAHIKSQVWLWGWGWRQELASSVYKTGDMRRRSAAAPNPSGQYEFLWLTREDNCSEAGTCPRETVECVGVGL